MGLRALLALCVAAYALLLSNIGCSSGAVCYRKTDCPTGTSCQSGQCVRTQALGDGGVAGSPSTDETAGSDGNASAGSDGTAGSEASAIAGSDGTAGGTE